MIRIPEHIQSLQPYVAGKLIEELARERNLTRIVKLASNENPLGPSPKAIEAVKNTLAASHRYVDPGGYRLTRAIADKYDLSPERIICGAGTDSLLAYIIQTFSSENDELLTSEGTFIGIYVNTNKLNRCLRKVSMLDYSLDLKGIASAIGEKTRIIYLANPNNPTGTIFSGNEFKEFMVRVPDDILVILDEAYYNYAASKSGYTNGFLCDYPNLIVTRTFSKDYGLAGLRIGFAYGPRDLIKELYKVRLPFEPSAPAQEAAIASLHDSAFLRNTLDLNERMLKLMAGEFESKGLRFVRSSTNFLLLIFPDETIASTFNSACLDRGLILRHVPFFGIPEGIRINSGTEDETTFAISVIEEVCQTLGGRLKAIDTKH